MNYYSGRTRHVTKNLSVFVTDLVKNGGGDTRGQFKNRFKVPEIGNHKE